MCQSSKPSSYHAMIHAEIPCSVIYSTDYDHVTLYALVLSNRMTHKCLSEKLDIVDMLMRSTGSPETTRFRSISNDPFNGKIKTFMRGEHARDPSYRKIFKTLVPGCGRKLEAHVGMFGWMAGDGDADAVLDEDDESGEDGDEDIQSPDPKPSGKKRAASSDGLDLKKMRLNDGDPSSVEGGMREEMRRLREELDGSKKENEALRTNAVSVFSPLPAPESIDPLFLDRSVCWRSAHRRTRRRRRSSRRRKPKQ